MVQRLQQYIPHLTHTMENVSCKCYASRSIMPHIHVIQMIQNSLSHLVSLTSYYLEWFFHAFTKCLRFRAKELKVLGIKFGEGFDLVISHREKGETHNTSHATRNHMIKCFLDVAMQPNSTLESGKTLSYSANIQS